MLDSYDERFPQEVQLYVVFKEYAVNWPKLHGNKPIIAKKIKMKKNRAQHFLEPPQGTYIKIFRLI